MNKETYTTIGTAMLTLTELIIAFVLLTVKSMTMTIQMTMVVMITMKTYKSDSDYDEDDYDDPNSQLNGLYVDNLADRIWEEND